MAGGFEIPESEAQALVQQREGIKELGAMMEQEDELALFLEMRKHEKGLNDLLLQHEIEELDDPLGSKLDTSPIFKIVSAPGETATHDFLDSQGEKNDYEWLLTPPGTPLFPCLETESNKPTIMSQIGTSQAHPAALKSRLANPQAEPTSRGTTVPRLTSSCPISSNTGMCRPLYSGGSGSAGSQSSRLATSTGRSILPAIVKPSRASTLTSRTTLSSSTRPSVTAARSTPTAPSQVPTSRLVTPTRLSSNLSSAPTGLGPPRRSSSVTKTVPLLSKNPEPSSRGISPAAKSSPKKPLEMPGLIDATPKLRTSLPEGPLSSNLSSAPTGLGPPRRSSSVTKTVPLLSKNPEPSRGISPAAKSSPKKPLETPGLIDATPKLRTSLPEGPLSSNLSSAPTGLGPPRRSSSVTKTVPLLSKNPEPSSRGISPAAKSSPKKPLETPGLIDATPKLRTSLPEGPLSVSRGRPGATTSRSSSVDPILNGRPRRQSRSPARGLALNGSIRRSGSSVPLTNHVHSNGRDSPNPVSIGTKMVERVINMRKLAPPKQGEQIHSYNNRAGKSSSSPDGSGFGRNLSKKSLDMALRHMDIRSISGSLRPSMTKIPASAMYSVRSGLTRSNIVSVSDSPITTSSNCSSEESEQSVNHNILPLHGPEIDAGIGSERKEGQSSPLSESIS